MEDLKNEQRKNGSEIEGRTNPAAKTPDPGLDATDLGSDRPGKSSEAETEKKSSRRKRTVQRSSGGAPGPGITTANDITPLLQQPGDKKPTRRGKVARLEEELENVRREKSELESAIVKRNSARILVTSAVSQINVLTQTVLPPPLAEEEEKALVEMWVPYLENSEVQISPVWLASIGTAGILLPRLLSLVVPKIKKRWFRK